LYGLGSFVICTLRAIRDTNAGAALVLGENVQCSCAHKPPMHQPTQTKNHTTASLTEEVITLNRANWENEQKSRVANLINDHTQLK
jgi:hypothetical protein